MISLLVSLIQPVWILSPDEASAKVLTPFYFTENNTFQYMPFTITAILSIAAITVIFTSIRKYKKRVQQMKLGVLISLLLVGVIGSSAYFASDLIKEFQGGRYGLGFYLPVVAVFSNLLANFFIRRDERLVRDSERLR